MQHSIRNYSIRASRSISAISLAVAAALAPPPAAAQDDAEIVIVTGSRIARETPLSAPVAVQAIDGVSITRSANFNVVDALNDLPALTASTTADEANQVGSIADGQNTLNLRGMGESRTLVLVNGRRHVPGVEGTQSVEISTIPPGLIERVEVLTGGASAIYGADAVTGVVNFILKEDYEGFEVTARTGLSGDSDAEQVAVSSLFGTNFADGRGNYTIGLDYHRDPGLKMSERSWAADNRISTNRPNPARRFQSGDISASATPNFAEYYDFDATGRYPYGMTIPTTATAFTTAYTNAFGTAPTLTAAESALIERAATAPTRAILPYPVFTISSTSGVIVPADFSMVNGIDLDGNGVEDCLDSFVGFNSSLDGAGFGMAGGCWVIDNGALRPFRDGLITGNFDGFGGDGIGINFSDELLIPRQDRVALNLTGRFELESGAELFGEAKYVYTQVEAGSPYNTFWDLLYGSPENPFLPAELQALAVAAGGLYNTRDMIDIGPAMSTTERTTMRFVAGIEGELRNGWRYEIAGNYGEHEQELTRYNWLMSDRFFAAIDVISDPITNQPICRSDIDPTSLPPTTIFEIPAWDSGFFTFTPGDGQCRPANIWAGVGGISQDALDFFTTTVRDKDTITQTAFSALVSGETDLALPTGGALSFALGAEWREEKSKARLDPLKLGIIPPGAPYPAGTLVEEHSDNTYLGFGGDTKYSNPSGRYDVYDVYGEVSLPILQNKLLAEELVIDAAYRYSDYSTIGDGETWKVGMVWSPAEIVRVRGSRSRAVRAPNIFELFSPDQAAFFRPDDPCAQAEIDALALSDAATAATRAANCLAAGISAGFVDPLSARFPGVSGGNPNLTEETADTTTYGIVLQPPAVPGLMISIDYWNMDVANAIAAVSAQDIVDNCYDSPTFPNDYCGLFDRNQDPTSAQFNGLTFLRQSRVNFGAIKAEGIDLATRYAFTAGANQFMLATQVTKQKNLDYYFDPADSTAVDPELGELFRPELAGSVSFSWARGPFQLGWTTQYLGEQALRSVEIETYKAQYGDAGIADEIYLHDLTAGYELNDSIGLFGGVQNVTDEQPYVTEFSWPTGPRGRFFYFGVNMAF